MKTKMKKEYLNAILIISSFFIGCIVGISILSLAISRDGNDLTGTIEKVEDAVVSIEAVKGSNVDSTGTGFIYKKALTKAYVLTNAHVVEDNEIYVTNARGEKTEGKVLGLDEDLDLAVLEIDKAYAPKTVTLGNSDQVKVGEEIFVISSPISKEYSNSVTKGIISGINRTVPTSLDDSEESLYDGIQFDAAVNPGSSGGPLFNKRGEVIGISTMKFIRLEIEGMGFAIPINQAKEHLKTLEKGENVKHPELGIAMVASTNKEQLELYDIKLKTSKEGVVVLNVKEGSNADSFLQKGDLITKINKTKTKETDDVKTALTQCKVGDTIHVTIIRDGKEKIVDIELK